MVLGSFQCAFWVVRVVWWFYGFFSVVHAVVGFLGVFMVYDVFLVCLVFRVLNF